MALFKKFFFKKPQEGLLEISERVFVLDCCFTTEVPPDEEYKLYIGDTVGQLLDQFPDASFMVFNFREGENQSLISSELSRYDMTVMDYPKHYEGCPVLTLETIHHFLKCTENWLLVAPHNLLLLNCEHGGWPILAFMLSALLIYRKQYTGEQKTLDMIYKQAPRELLQLMSPINPLPSQLRYLQYVSRRNVGSEWPPKDRALTLDCVIMRAIPRWDAEGGFRPIFRIYGQDPLMTDRTPQLLFSTPKESKAVRHHKQVPRYEHKRTFRKRRKRKVDFELVKIDIHSHIQGDVVLECITLDPSLEHEEMVFRVVFNTAFIRANILILNRDQIDTLWNFKDLFPKEFRLEILFSEMDATSTRPTIDIPSTEEKEGIPIEAFAKVEEYFNNVDWIDQEEDLTLHVLQQIKAANMLREKLKSVSEDMKNLFLDSNSDDDEKKPTISGDSVTSPDSLSEVEQSPSWEPYDDASSTRLRFDEREDRLSFKGSDMMASLNSKLLLQKIRTKREKDPTILSPHYHRESTDSSLDGDSARTQGQEQDCLSSFQSPLGYYSGSSSFDSTNLQIDHVSTKSEEVKHPFWRPSSSISYLDGDSGMTQGQERDYRCSFQSPLGYYSGSSSFDSTNIHTDHASTKSEEVKHPFWPPSSSISSALSSVAKPLDPTIHATPKLPKSFSQELLGAQPTNDTPSIARQKVEPMPSLSPKPFIATSQEGESLKRKGQSFLTPPTPIRVSPSPSPPHSPLLPTKPLQIPKPIVPSPPSPPILLPPPSVAPALEEEQKPCSSVPPPPGPPLSSGPSPSTIRESYSTPLPATLASPTLGVFPKPPSPPCVPSASSPISKPTTPTPTPSPPPPSTPSSKASAPPPPPPPLSRKVPPPPPPPCTSSSSSPKSRPLAPTPPPPPPSTSSSRPSAPPPPPPPSSNSAKCPPPPPPPLSNSAKGPPPPPPPLSNSAKGPLPPPPPLSNSAKGPPPPPPPISNSSAKNGPGPPTPSPPAAPLLGKGRGLSRLNAKSQAKSNLKPYHWLKLTRAMQGSLWAETQKPDESLKAPEFDMAELESLFSASSPHTNSKKPSGKSRGSSGKPEKVQLIDLRRAYNCEIMLSKVKVPIADIMNSVLALDDIALDGDQVENLIKFCPSKEEMELLKNYNGDKQNLGKCELFFLELMKVPRVQSKLRVFLFKIQFHSQVSDLRDSLNIVNAASEEIRSSVKLKRIMQAILSLGNALNQGTARGSAIGFRLDSLLKLTDTRARNKKITLMHYLCKVLTEKLPEVIDFPKDLTNLESATKIHLKYLAEEMQALSKGLEKVIQELSASENDGPISEGFREILQGFLGFAEGEVRSLASMYSNVGRNADALALYFGEDPARCPFEQVVTTLMNFVRMFVRAHEENCKLMEMENKKLQQSESENLKLKISALQAV